MLARANQRSVRRGPRPLNAAGHRSCTPRGVRCWWRSALVLAVVPLVAGTAACSGKGARSRPTPPSASCAASVVHYVPYPGVERGLAQLPWIAASPTASGIVGHLFYYDNQNVWERRHLPRVRIYSQGQSPDGRLTMKILWQTHRRGPGLMRVHGDRLDSPGSFSQQLSPTASNARQYPSIIDVPTAGCWRLTLMADTTTGHVTITAVPRRAS